MIVITNKVKRRWMMVLVLFCYHESIDRSSWWELPGEGLLPCDLASILVQDLQRAVAARRLSSNPRMSIGKVLRDNAPKADLLLSRADALSLQSFSSPGVLVSEFAILGVWGACTFLA